MLSSKGDGGGRGVGHLNFNDVFIRLSWAGREWAGLNSTDRIVGSVCVSVSL